MLLVSGPVAALAAPDMRQVDPGSERRPAIIAILLDADENRSLANEKSSAIARVFSLTFHVEKQDVKGQAKPY
jgi:hypothetical protein